MATAEPAQSEPPRAEAHSPAEPEPAASSPEQTPPVPGPRAARLDQLYNQALDHTLSKLAYPNFNQCYPTIAARSEGLLRNVQGQVVERLGEKCRKEFKDIVAARRVVGRLNELEGLIAEAQERRKDGREPGTAPHLLPPEEILAAHLHPSLVHHQGQLNARLQTTQSQNAMLHDEVLAQRREIEDLVGRLEGVLGDVRGANAVLGEVVGELSREAVEGRRVVDEA